MVALETMYKRVSVAARDPLPEAPRWCRGSWISGGCRAFLGLDRGLTVPTLYRQVTYAECPLSFCESVMLVRARQRLPL